MTSPLEIFSDRMAVFGAAGRYIQGRGVVDVVGPCAAQIGRKALLLSDQIVLAMLEERVRNSCDAAWVKVRSLRFDGKLGPGTAAALADRMEPCWLPDMVIAAGGGRAIDAGKALADRLGCALITLPTAASTDAPTSKNYVLYDNDGLLVEVCHMARNPDFVIVDTQILASAPKLLFAAGLGDAVSKGAEAEACAAGRGTNMFLARPTRLGTFIAGKCHDCLMRHGVAAYDVAGSGQVTDDFEAAVEAMILMAGLGFENGGLSVPHALTRGLPLLPGGAKAQHGFQVAYGLVVHYALLGQALPSNLVQLYRHVGLPRSLCDLTGHRVTALQIDSVVKATMPVRHMLNFPHDLTGRHLTEAILAVEAQAAPIAT